MASLGVIAFAFLFLYLVQDDASSALPTRSTDSRLRNQENSGPTAPRIRSMPPISLGFRSVFARLTRIPGRREKHIRRRRRAGAPPGLASRAPPRPPCLTREPASQQLSRSADSQPTEPSHPCHVTPIATPSVPPRPHRTVFTALSYTVWAATGIPGAATCCQYSGEGVAGLSRYMNRNTDRMPDRNPISSVGNGFR